MMPPRACKLLLVAYQKLLDEFLLDFFIGLNIIRALSIIALILVFASNIVTLVHDVQAVNRFLAAGNTAGGTSNNSTVVNDDYILCVHNTVHQILPSFTSFLAEEALFQTKQQASFGPY